MANIHTFLRSDPKLMPVNETEIQFFNKLKLYHSLVKAYEDFRLQEMARGLVPWKQMTITAINKMLKIRQTLKNSGQDCGTDSKDILLIDLLEWYKNEFFEWFDCAVCDKCNKKTTNPQNVSPNEDEMRWSAMTVELYSCADCGREYRFPRYNSAEKLLTTRRGRCGEWANCFTLLCRAMNFSARLVVDWTDHVWTEVYSDAQKRWLHCDPCEGICDSPLVYECGWAKKLTFCIAFAVNEVQDVSWRYSKDHPALRQRRALMCREEWVANVLDKMTANLWLAFSPELKEQLKLRRLLEFVEFLRVPNQSSSVKDDEHKGRQSGSQAWRLARQEISDQELTNHYVFELSDNNVNPTLITYNSAADEYRFNSKILKSWKNCVFESENIMRKVEKDWKMSYLSRNESNAIQTGRIKWKLNLKSDVKWSEMRITIKCKVFENGFIRLYVYSTEDNRLEMKPNTENIFKRSEVPLTGDIIIEAILDGGTGSTGWQHSQLFRQSLSDESE
ncbi:unnamed protein product, partial [Oppiella nova]